MSWLPEVVLRCKRQGADGAHETVYVGSTATSSTVRAVAQQLVTEADRHAQARRELDPILGAVAETEAERISRLTELLIGDTTSSADLHLVPRATARPRVESPEADGGGIR